MTRLFIPELGTVLVLAWEWTFTLKNERRNQTFARWLGYKSASSRYPLGAIQGESFFGERCYLDGRRERVEYKRYSPSQIVVKYTLKPGTELIVDRIYIRKGNADFSSVTFKMKVDGKIVRFFASLHDVNQILMR